MTGEELNKLLNVCKASHGAKRVPWNGAPIEYRAALEDAGTQLQYSGNGQGLGPTPNAAPALQAAAPAPVTTPLPALPSTPGVDPKMSVFVSALKPEEAQTLYELLYSTRGCRIYKH